jgi:quercetin dioxygenase-like cupin family protein
MRADQGGPVETVSDANRKSCFGTWNDVEPYELFPNVRLHAVGGDQVLLCRVNYVAGSHVKRHSHELTEQVMVLLEGDVTMEVEGERRRMEPGDVAVVSKGREHELWSEHGCTFMEALAPVLLDHVGDPERDLVLGPEHGSTHVPA